MNLPNVITLGRILLVPVVVWAIGANQMQIAFVLFVVAGISDAIDGYLAKRFNMTSEIGALLDPLADKALLVSIYVTLAIVAEIPAWLAILVVSRDIMIVGAVIISWLLGNPVEIRPVMISKVNTAAQIVFAGFMLFRLASGLNLNWLQWPLLGLVCVLTAASMLVYLTGWLRHMSE